MKGAYIGKLIRGQGYEIAWAAVNKQQARRGFQWMLEHLGGHQFRHFSLSAEKARVGKARAPQGEDEQDAGWDFIINNGERDPERGVAHPWLERETCAKSIGLFGK